MSCSLFRSNRTVWGVADITQQHTCQVRERSARLECGWSALTLPSHFRSSVDRAKICTFKERKEREMGEVRNTHVKENTLETNGVTLMNVGEYN